MQVLCGLQGIFLLFNCQTPGFYTSFFGDSMQNPAFFSVPIFLDFPRLLDYNPVFDSS